MLLRQASRHHPATHPHDIPHQRKNHKTTISSKGLDPHLTPAPDSVPKPTYSILRLRFFDQQYPGHNLLFSSSALAGCSTNNAFPPLHKTTPFRSSESPTSQLGPANHTESDEHLQHASAPRQRRTQCRPRPSPTGPPALISSLDATINGCRPLHCHLLPRLANSLTATQLLIPSNCPKLFKPLRPRSPQLHSLSLPPSTPTSPPRCRSLEPLRLARSGKVSRGTRCRTEATPPRTQGLSDTRSRLRSSSSSQPTSCLTMLQTFSPRHPDLPPPVPPLDRMMTCSTPQQMPPRHPPARIWTRPRGRCPRSPTISPATSHLPPRASRPPLWSLPLPPRRHPHSHQRHRADRGDRRRP